GHAGCGSRSLLVPRLPPRLQGRGEGGGQRPREGHPPDRLLAGPRGGPPPPPATTTPSSPGSRSGSGRGTPMTALVALILLASPPGYPDENRVQLKPGPARGLGLGRCAACHSRDSI